ncbi:MAG: hypothetical protein AAF196_06110 [Planctomycetota bacterium]
MTDPTPGGKAEAWRITSEPRFLETGEPYDAYFIDDGELESTITTFSDTDAERIANLPVTEGRLRAALLLLRTANSGDGSEAWNRTRIELLAEIDEEANDGSI